MELAHGRCVSDFCRHEVWLRLPAPAALRCSSVLCGPGLHTQCPSLPPVTGKPRGLAENRAIDTTPQPSSGCHSRGWRLGGRQKARGLLHDGFWSFMCSVCGKSFSFSILIKLGAYRGKRIGQKSMKKRMKLPVCSLELVGISVNSPLLHILLCGVGLVLETQSHSLLGFFFFFTSFVNIRIIPKIPFHGFLRVNHSVRAPNSVQQSDLGLKCGR